MGKSRKQDPDMSNDSTSYEDGLGNQAILSKIDKLRELNVGAIIPLPQLIVVGDQSSGKSSVLEGLTGFSFPRAAGLCTRYATQITCRREPQDSVCITIIPRPSAGEALKIRLRQFQRSARTLDNDKLAKVFDEANKAMGIRIGAIGEGESGAVSSSGGAFIEDILKIEICGPDQQHLTVIDVPGIFRNATPGLTTDDDVQLVRNMVKTYMGNTRTVILAVMPCNVDIATQEIIKLAEAADPGGARTMGVLTKPDLATERATQGAVIDLLLGKRSNLSLGYCVVKNRSADDNDSTLDQRRQSEKVFFSAPEWSAVTDRCGVPSLQRRLRELLMQISKREFPNVKLEIERRLKQCEGELSAMGASRQDESSQRLFLGKIASRYQTLVQCAVSGQYIGDVLFRTEASLKLATRMMGLNERFANDMWKFGHKFVLASDADDANEIEFNSENYEQVCGEIDLDEYAELEDIIECEEYECESPTDKPLLEFVKDVHLFNRGPEIGTFGATILGLVFEEQSEKWDGLVISHMSKAIVLVHEFITKSLADLCPDEQILNQLWDSILIDKLRTAYKKAMDHVRFLLSVERGGRPTTFNHYFNATLQEKRGAHLSEAIDKLRLEEANLATGLIQCYRAEDVRDSIVPKSNSIQVCDDIVDTLASYYKVARKRFVDTVCQQAINHHLLDGEGSPLRILSPDLVMALSPRQLDLVAGEDAASRRHREVLGRERDSLRAAKKVLRE